MIVSTVLLVQRRTRLLFVYRPKGLFQDISVLAGGLVHGIISHNEILYYIIINNTQQVYYIIHIIAMHITTVLHDWKWFLTVPTYNCSRQSNYQLIAGHDSARRRHLPSRQYSTPSINYLNYYCNCYVYLLSLLSLSV